MTKLEEELDSLFDFSEEQLQEREHHFMKKMWVSVGIIVAVLVALSISTFAMFSTTKQISAGEELKASEFNVDAMLNGTPANSINTSICEIGTFTVFNENVEDGREFTLSLVPTGTQGVKGYCKILVNEIPYYIPVQVEGTDSTQNIYIKLEKGTEATIKVEFSWATLNPGMDNILTNNATILVENTDEVEAETEGDTTKDDANITPIENEEGKDTTPAEEIENIDPIVDDQEIPEEEELDNEI